MTAPAGGSDKAAPDAQDTAPAWDPAARDEEGRTGLHLAAANNVAPGVVHALLDAGADPNARDRFGHTPLHMAVNAENETLARILLLDGGSDPTAHDADGKLPYEHARKNVAIHGSDAYRRLHDASIQ